MTQKQLSPALQIDEVLVNVSWNCELMRYSNPREIAAAVLRTVANVVDNPTPESLNAIADELELLM